MYIQHNLCTLHDLCRPSAHSSTTLWWDACSTSSTSISCPSSMWMDTTSAGPPYCSIPIYCDLVLCSSLKGTIFKSPYFKVDRRWLCLYFPSGSILEENTVQKSQVPLPRCGREQKLESKVVRWVWLQWTLTEEEDLNGAVVTFSFSLTYTYDCSLTKHHLRSVLLRLFPV